MSFTFELSTQEFGTFFCLNIVLCLVEYSIYFHCFLMFPLTWSCKDFKHFRNTDSSSGSLVATIHLQLGSYDKELCGNFQFFSMFGVLLRICVVFLYILELFGKKEENRIPKLKPKLPMNFSTQAKLIVSQKQ